MALRCSIAYLVLHNRYRRRVSLSHLVLSRISHPANLLESATTFAKSVRKAIALSRVAEHAMNRGVTGDPLHRLLMREMQRGN